MISFDEMKIQAQFQYDQKNDEVLVPGKYVQVLMARRIIGNWKQPIFYDFDCKMTQDVLFNVISEIESAGFHVVAMVSDLGPTNRGLLTELSITPQTPYFTNPIHPTENVYVFADVPHLVKLIRNHFVDTGFIINGNPINKDIIEELILHTNKKSELSIAYKVTEESLNVKGPGRQKVKLATKLFSHTVSQAIDRAGSTGHLKSPNWTTCSNFFKIVSMIKTILIIIS